MDLIMGFKKRFLDTPLVNRGSGSKYYSHMDWCNKEAMPHAIFAKASRYGGYFCDLTPLLKNGLRLSEEGCQQMKEALEAIFTQWFNNKNLFKGKMYISYTYGPVTISVSPCPIGEEGRVHQAVCEVLSQNIEPCDRVTGWEQLRSIKNLGAFAKRARRRGGVPVSGDWLHGGGYIGTDNL